MPSSPGETAIPHGADADVLNYALRRLLMLPVVLFALSLMLF
ncbi:ABC transporter permease, partial [Mesorhizobium sp. M2D.F.Ca.ET.145.01.1.1]